MNTLCFYCNKAIQTEYGLNCAVLLHNIYFWVEHNKEANKNFKDGKYWTYNSVKALSEQLPLTPGEIRTAIKKLIKAGLIEAVNHNDICSRTLWYTTTQKAVDILCEEESTPSTETTASENKETNVTSEPQANINNATSSVESFFNSKNNQSICKNSKTICKNYKSIKDNKPHIKNNKVVERKINKKKELCVDILDYWNSKPLVKCFELNEALEAVMLSALDISSLEQIKLSIDHYAETVTSGYMFTYLWSLKNFLKKSNAMPTFFDTGEKWLSYKYWLKYGKNLGNKEQMLKNHYTEEQISKLITNLDDVEV